jgi:hypothetical protein
MDLARRVWPADRLDALHDEALHVDRLTSMRELGGSKVLNVGVV